MGDYCLKCGMCCRLIPLDKEAKFLLRDGKTSIDDSFLFNLEPLSEDEAYNINEPYVQKVQNIYPDAKFYSCKYLSNENICLSEEKPEFCTNFPSGKLSIIPDECGYAGEIFLEQEKLKQKIRKIKEEIMDYEAQIEANHPDSDGFRKIITVLNKNIQKYAAYGSADW